ncbi:MFS transporter [Bacillus sp. CGMCC 1.16607]|uniref:MFS transporter n=1 Tax=Bacillus sp. CGMCC 1.16607 TaxID=3351842 RepID=UPI003627C423
MRSNFSKLWLGQSLSVFGHQISTMSIPLIAVVVIKGNPLQMGFLQAVSYTPILLFSLVVGTLVDRHRKVPILVVSDVARFITLLMIPCLYIFDMLTIIHLYFVAFFLGIFTTFFDIAYLSLVTKVVTENEIIKANSKLEGTRSVSMAVSPGIAGMLIQLLSAPFAIIFNIGAFMLSSLVLATIKEEKDVKSIEEVTTKRKSLLLEAKSGYQVIINNAKLRVLALSTALLNLFSTMMAPIFLLFLTQELKLNPFFTGIVLASTGIGGIIGSVLASKIANLVGKERSLVISLIMGAFSVLLLPVVSDNSIYSILYLILTQLLLGVSITIFRVNQISIRMMIVPINTQGRVNALLRLIMMSLVPIGSLIGGVLGEILGEKGTLFISGIGLFFTFFVTKYFLAKSKSFTPKNNQTA